MHVYFSFAVLFAICSQSLGAGLSGLYRIQTTDGQDLVLTGQGDGNPPTFEEPKGKGTQIWRFEDERDGTTLIQNVPTNEYLHCRSDSCLESKDAQGFYVESHGPNLYRFSDPSQRRFLRQTDQGRIESAGSNGSNEVFNVIRVEFCELQALVFLYLSLFWKPFANRRRLIFRVLIPTNSVYFVFSSIGSLLAQEYRPLCILSSPPGHSVQRTSLLMGAAIDFEWHVFVIIPKQMKIHRFRSPFILGS